ncbi:MAG TPA: hypothetical protein VGH15_09245 [Caulobacteraceae bacterium]
MKTALRKNIRRLGARISPFARPRPGGEGLAHHPLLDTLLASRGALPLPAPSHSPEAESRAAQALHALQAARRTALRSAYAALARGEAAEALRLMKADLSDPRIVPAPGAKAYDALRSAGEWRRLAALAWFVDGGLAAEAYEQVLRHEPADAWSAIFLSRLYRISARTQLARDVVAAALPRVDDPRTEAVLLGEAAIGARECGDLPAARSAHQRTVDVWRGLAEAEGGGDARRALATACLRLGDVARDDGDLEAARTAYAEALGLLQDLAAGDPDSSQALHDLAAAHVRFGLLERAHDDLERARAAYQSDLAIRRALVEKAPADVDFRRELAMSHMRLGLLARDYDELTLARAALDEEVAIRDALALADPDDRQLAIELSAAHLRLAHLVRRRGDEAKAAHDLAGARGHFEEDLELRQRLLRLDPANEARRRDVQISEKRLEQVAMAEELLAQAVAMKAQAAAREAERLQRIADLARLNAHRNEGDQARDKGEFETARRCYLADIATRQAIADKAPGDAEAAEELRAGYTCLAQLARRQGEEALATGNLALARRYLEEDLGLRERLRALDEGNPARERDIQISNKRLEQVAWLENEAATREQQAAARERAAAAARLAALRSEGDRAHKDADYETARRCYLADIAARQALVDEAPHDAAAAAALLAGWTRLAQVARAQGEEAKAAGDLAAARRFCQEDLELRERLRRADPANEARARDAIVSGRRLEQVDALERRAVMRGKQAAAAALAELLRAAQTLRRQGDEARAAGDLAAARRLGKKDLALRERLRKSDRSSPSRERDVLISRKRLQQIAGLEKQAAAREKQAAAREKQAAARRSMDAARQRKASAARLAAARMEGNLARKRGDMARAAGDLDAARKAYEVDVEVGETRLAAGEGHGADLAVSYLRLGHVLRALASTAQASHRAKDELHHLAQDVGVRRKLSHLGADNSAHQEGLAMSLARLVAAADRAGDLPLAREAHAEELAIREARALASPGEQTARALRASYLRLGRVLRAAGDRATQAGDLAAARTIHREDLDLREALLLHDPDDAALRRDRAISQVRLKRLVGKPPRRARKPATR